MSKAKVDFIADLLSNKAIKPVHKEKLFSLVSKELEKFGESDERIISRLKELEAEIKVIKSKQAGDTEDEFKFPADGIEDDNGITIAELLREELPGEEDEIVKKREAFWKMVADKKKITEEITEKENSDLPEYKDPSKLSQFLESYNQHPILKYTCHTIDDNEIIDSIKERCGILEYNFIEIKS